MLNRREFVSLLAAASLSWNEASSSAMSNDGSAGAAGWAPGGQPAQEQSGGFPPVDYTPFGYLDNPWHTWNMHQSGVFRSLPGVGFGLYFPAGPGGYFDFHRNGVYVAELAVAFRIGDRMLMDPSDYTPGQISARHHSKNLLAYSLNEGGIEIECSFFQVNEDALAAELTLVNQGGQRQQAEVLAMHTYQLGGSQWWGGDGIAGDFAEEVDCVWTRSFAAGTVFAVTCDQHSGARFFSHRAEDRRTWLGQEPKPGNKVSYGTDPLHAGVSFAVAAEPKAEKRLTLLMARGVNLPATLKHARASLADAASVKHQKLEEDKAFWSGAPRLTGDWPAHWRNGWVYDFETLRTMVRRPIGLYKHRWDAMQIQAPRNVLAETSIDMWALSYADPGTAKEVFLGQFLDAVVDNIPCMREDGVMNMVAADGSQCGTSISWCFPFFCAASIYNRTRDREWLRQLYPRMCALLRWTLKNRVDAEKYIVGKCSWETGMDTSKRFQIQQPTGGEAVEFLRLVELQAAASQAGGILAHFASVLGDQENKPEWQRLQKEYAEKTQQLWKGDWFRDFDTRASKLVESADRDPSQAAPAFCGIATEEQSKAMLSTLRAMYERMQKNRERPESSADEALNWSSFVLPFVESAYAAGDRSLASATVQAICERIYTGMDRRSLQSSDAPQARLGWPGTSCEVWGAHGAFGGEVYGWGAVMPAHIIRNLLGFRETEEANQFVLSPGFGPGFAVSGKRYALDRLPYAGKSVGVSYAFSDEKQLISELRLPAEARLVNVTDADGRAMKFSRKGNLWEIAIENHGQYHVKVEGLAVS
jgi:hypothetical protein